MLTGEITVTVDLWQISPQGNINRHQDGWPQFTSVSILDATSVANVENGKHTEIAYKDHVRVIFMHMIKR